MRRLVWLSPTIIVLSTIAVGLVTFVIPDTAVRLVIVFWFLFICPGMALVRFFHLDELLVEWILALALSFAIDAIVAGIQLYAGWWSPTATLEILMSVSLAGVIIQIGLDTAISLIREARVSTKLASIAELERTQTKLRALTQLTALTQTDSDDLERTQTKLRTITRPLEVPQMDSDDLERTQTNPQSNVQSLNDEEGRGSWVKVIRRFEDSYQLSVCVCGYVDDRPEVRYCPDCGKPMSEQNVFDPEEITEIRPAVLVVANQRVSKTP